MTSKQIPPFIYGTAWKEDATAELTKRAVSAGFRGIANGADSKEDRDTGQRFLVNNACRLAQIAVACKPVDVDLRRWCCSKLDLQEYIERGWLDQEQLDSFKAELP